MTLCIHPLELSIDFSARFKFFKIILKKNEKTDQSASTLRLLVGHFDIFSFFIGSAVCLSDQAAAALCPCVSVCKGGNRISCFHPREQPDRDSGPAAFRVFFFYYYFSLFFCYEIRILFFIFQFQATRFDLWGFFGRLTLSADRWRWSENCFKNWKKISKMKFSLDVSSRWGYTSVEVVTTIFQPFDTFADRWRWSAHSKKNCFKNVKIFF